MSFFDKINNYLIVDAIKEIPKGRDPEESLPDSVYKQANNICSIKIQNRIKGALSPGARTGLRNV